MDILSSLDYWFWTPVLAWVGLYFWFKRVSYPTFLKKQMLKGQKWAFVPVWKGSWAVGDRIFAVLTSLFSALPVIWVLFNWTDAPWYGGFAATPLFLLLSLAVCSAAKNKTAKLFQSAYYLEYRKVRYASDIKGVRRNEMDLQNKTLWSYTKKLKNAEAHGRLWKYVNAMAKTKKIPPDIYAETMYV